MCDASFHGIRRGPRETGDETDGDDAAGKARGDPGSKTAREGGKVIFFTLSHHIPPQVPSCLIAWCRYIRDTDNRDREWQGDLQRQR